MFGTKKLTLTEADLASRIARAYRDGVESEKSRLEKLNGEGATKIDLFGLKDDGKRAAEILQSVLDTGYALAKDNKKITALKLIGDAFNPIMIIEWKGSRGETVVNKPSMEQIEKLRAASKAAADDIMKEAIAKFMVKVVRDTANKTDDKNVADSKEEVEEECNCILCDFEKRMERERNQNDD